MTYPISRAQAGAPLTATQHDGNLRSGGGFATISEMVADKTAWDTGTILTAAGHRYQVAASASHLETAGRVHLTVLPSPDGVFNFLAFNPPADGVNDDRPALMRAIYETDPWPSSGNRLRAPAIYMPTRDYLFSDTIPLKRAVRIFGDHSKIGDGLGPLLEWDTDTTGPGFMSMAANQWYGYLIYSGDESSLDMGQFDDGDPDSEDAFLNSTHAFEAGNLYHVIATGDIYEIKESDDPDFDVTTAGGVRAKDVTSTIPDWVLEDGTGAQLEGLRIKGPTNQSGETGQHGIHMRRAIAVKDCKVSDWAGHGIYIMGTRFNAQISSTAYPWEGNVNNWGLENVSCIQNDGCGIHVVGKDANAGTAININCSQNGQWGIWDDSFLGCSWVICHANSNGNPDVAAVPSNGGAWVHYNGRHYMAHPHATEEELRTITPGSATQVANASRLWTSWGGDVWEDIGAGSARSQLYPTWEASQPANTYRPGGAYCCSNQNNNSLFLGCYMENSNRSAFRGRSIIMGGIGEVWTGGKIEGRNGGSMLADAYETTYSPDTPSVRMEAVGPNGRFLGFVPAGTSLESTTGWGLRFTSDAKDLLFNRDSAYDDRWQTWAGPDTDQQFGRGVDVPFATHIHHLAIGDGSDVTGNGRLVRYGTAAPTSGTYARGEIVLNREPTAGGYAGWICVSGGSPGTWKGFARIDA